MHTIELLEEARAVAELLGYKVREEWLGGTAGGGCEIAGRKWLFLDLALNANEQLDQIVTALQSDPSVHNLRLSPKMTQLLGIRKSA